MPDASDLAAGQAHGPASARTRRKAIAAEAQTGHKVQRQLDEVMPKAARAQKAGANFDLRLYFRENEDGYYWAKVAFLDGDNGHRILDNMPLVGPDVVSWFFGEITERGFPLAAERRTS